MNEPVTLISFDENSTLRWNNVDDGVMGGVSRGALRFNEEGTAEFMGILSLENNGGFSSVRAAVEAQDLSEFSGVELKVRGDGRTYQLRFRTNAGFDGVAYRAEFSTKMGQWVTLRLPFEDFLPTYRGRILGNERTLDTTGIRQIGFLLADKNPGPFRLEIDSLITY